MEKPVFKRVIAYIIDIFIVTIISSSFSNIALINPYIDEYNELSNRYLNVLKNTEALTSETMVELEYEYIYYGFYVLIIMLVFKLIYFVVFQYYNKGQTIGKALMKIKIDSRKGKLKFWQVLVRSLIAYNMITSLISIVLIKLLDKSSFMNAYSVISYIEVMITIVIVGTITIRRDNNGLHDLVAKTTVNFKEKEEKNENRNS